MKKLFLVSVFTFLLTVLMSTTTNISSAQEASPSATVAQAAASSGVKAVEVLKGATDAVNKAAEQLPVALPAMLSAIILLLSEWIMRKYPTVNPKSWFLVGAWVLDAFASLLTAIAALVRKGATLLDSVVPNNKPEPEKK